MQHVSSAVLEEVEQNVREKRALAVVSDSECASDVISMLKRAGFQAHLAATGRQAVGVCLQEEFDIAFVSDRLCDSDSFAIISQLRKKSNGYAVPVIMLLSQRDDQTAVAALRCGAQDAIALDRLPNEDLSARIGAVLKRANTELIFDHELINADLLTLEAQKRQELILGRIDEFVHALRTPLGAINEFVSLALDGVGGPVTEQTGKYLAHARGACWTLDREIERLHQLASMDGGISSGDTNHTDLAEVVRYVVECLEPYAKHHYTVLSSVYDEQTPPVAGDRFLLCQILLRLASHAIESTGNGGFVSIELRPTPTQVVLGVRMHHCDPKNNIEFLHKTESANDFLHLPQLKSCEQLLQAIQTNLSFSDDGRGSGEYSFELPRIEREALNDE